VIMKKRVTEKISRHASWEVSVIILLRVQHIRHYEYQCGACLPH